MSLTAAFRPMPDAAPRSAVRMPVGQTALLDPVGSDGGGRQIEVLEGVGRVLCPCEETEGMTLAFLHSGDRLMTDRLCSEGICIEALTGLSFVVHNQPTEAGVCTVNEWTLQLLRIRHFKTADLRLQALMGLLVSRLGRRMGDWCTLPFRLTHERIAELIGTTRVTTTRLMSKARAEGLFAPEGSDNGLRVSPLVLRLVHEDI
ncbi:MAG: Crp/Fnr family transcriptional regulator [Aphanocapsa feldmannii 277cV]|uniref:Crp/Fnr family transcriptional regulator n=2 Tax=Aphanocapsa feldmannii TaxID=192050 RepID=A0A524RN56_9CHRO|nr:MAG: Crp/Fnr family transcriptional regulator [Aphanocapsa feldmannii 288cV]TGG92235.1 MAG: Crp/Fnr family transcriptional regulator [Aphanocapsa feldmannii 277cV]TGH19751.1 MAG: Crp/Fnr family transcriptional regulator [Aphanocapsa feldmannii 277cI]